MFRRPFYLLNFSCRNVPSLRFGVNVRRLHGGDYSELDCTNRRQARQKRRLRPIAGQDGAWLYCAIWCREKTGFLSLASKPDCGCRRRRYKDYESPEQLVWSRQKWFVQYKRPMCASHLRAFHYLTDGLEASLGKTTLGLYFSDKGG